MKQRMVRLDYDLYIQTRNVLLGKEKLHPATAEFLKWINNRYSINAINLEFSKFNKKEADKYSHRLDIIVNSKKDYNSMFVSNGLRYNEDYRKEIADKFIYYAKKYKHPIKNAKKIWVCYTDFSVEIKTDTNRKAMEEAKPIIKDHYKDIMLWDMFTAFESVVVFYMHDSNIQEYSANGISQRIKQDYFDLLKKHDELGYYTPDNSIIDFDSKENLDKNYEGNLFYYFR